MSCQFIPPTLKYKFLYPLGVGVRGKGFYIGCNLEIDRKENDKGYSPENCQYITKSENLLKMPCVNMTKEDVFFIRSEEFDISKIKEYGYKRNIVKNILTGRAFKDLV